MEGLRILWIDLRQGRNTPCISDDLSGAYEINVIDNPHDIEAAVEEYQPSVLCFDYDLPDQLGHRVLEKIRSQYPWLPLLVLTQDRTVETAVWALRLRVWDYFTKPVEIDEIIGIFAGLPKPGPKNCRHQADCWAIQPPGLPEPQPGGAAAKKISIALAMSYVRQHLDKKISLQVVAKLCGMSKSHFSRSFKSIRGITFQEFLARQRMDRALVLLKDSDIQVTQVAFAVGFAELSNFTRTFQRHIGMSPSYYRKAITSELLQNGDGQTQTVKFPKANPNPVLSVGPNGIPQFVNPAASYLLKEIGLQEIKFILPIKHTELVKQCQETGIPMSDERRIAGRTIVWSYCPIDDSDVTHLYGNDVSDYLTDHLAAKGLASKSPYPVLSSERDGVPQFRNSATSQLLKELGLEKVEDILPPNHKGLVKACLNSGTPLAEKHSTAGRTIVWSYRPTGNNNEIYIYGRTISG